MAVAPAFQSLFERWRWNEERRLGFPRKRATGNAARSASAGTPVCDRRFVSGGSQIEGSAEVDKPTKREVLIVTLANLVPIPLFVGAVVVILH
jgi:hypothetical protein